MKETKSKTGRSGYEKVTMRDNSRSIDNIIIVENSLENLLPKENGELKSDKDGACKFHIHNQCNIFLKIKVHIFCLTCNDLICDKCAIEEHDGHQTEDFQIAKNNDFAINILTNFYNKMSKNNEEKLRNFKEIIGEAEKIVDEFFHAEIEKIDNHTKQLRTLLKELNSKVRKLVLLYQQKFREEFQSAREEYERFQEELYNSKYINQLKIFLFFK